MSVVCIPKKSGELRAGCSQRTLLNCLVGINAGWQYRAEISKISSVVSHRVIPDIITDLSTILPVKFKPIWKYVFEETPCAAGTVPIYALGRTGGVVDHSHLLELIIEQIEGGVGVLTIHPTASLALYEKAKSRFVPVTSRGGMIVLRDMLSLKRCDDNVYIQILPDIIKYAKKHRAVLSIGATFRSANIFDSNDEAQNDEIKRQIEIADYISENGVGVIVESPGHCSPVDIRKIAIILRNSNYPIMPLGPIPTDIAHGFDHLASAIGAVLLGVENCAHILSVVTRCEHTGDRPTTGDVLEALDSARIAAHIIDMNNTMNYSDDLKIVEDTVRFNSCLGSPSKCNRCDSLCPLKIMCECAPL